VYEFNCGHQECSSQIRSSNKDELMRQVTEHLKESHNVQTASQTILGYLETTCVTTTSDR
jgi:predicted small metal-binding protein